MAKGGKQRPLDADTEGDEASNIGTPHTGVPITGASAGFEPACRAAADELRAALFELYGSVKADPTNPQEVARRFGVNKTLTWTISRVLAAQDAVEMVATAPGAGSMKSLITAMEKAGATPASVARVWAAVRAADETVAFHVGDRSTLQLIVDGMSPSRDDHLEASRRLAFRGNSGLWGVQARLRTTTAFIAPNAGDAKLLDIVFVRGLVGLRRLRTNLSWPIFHMRNWGTERPSPQPLDDPAAGEQASPILRRFSALSPNDIIETRTSDGAIYTLAPGPIGNTGAVDCFAADIERGTLPRFASGDDKSGEIGANVSVPVEKIVIDLIAHESLPFVLNATPDGYTALFGGPGSTGGPYGRIPVPISTPPTRLPGPPLTAALAGVPSYTEMVRFVFERTGWDPRHFAGRRCEFSYPPLGATISLVFDLPSKG